MHTFEYFHVYLNILYVLHLITCIIATWTGPLDVLGLNARRKRWPPVPWECVVCGIHQGLGLGG